MQYPHHELHKDNERLRAEVLQKYLSGISRYTSEPIEECLAQDAHGVKTNYGLSYIL